MQIPNEAKLALSELLPLALDAQIVGITTDGMVDSLRLVCDAQLAKAAPIIEAQARKEERERIIYLLAAHYNYVDNTVPKYPRHRFELPEAVWEALKL